MYLYGGIKISNRNLCPNTICNVLYVPLLLHCQCPVIPLSELHVNDDSDKRIDIKMYFMINQSYFDKILEAKLTI